jgi:hypothetical protein
MLSLNNVIREFQVNPVLMDIGAAGSPPEAWSRIAAESVYVAFDPNAETLKQGKDGGFHKSVILNKAVSPLPVGNVNFFTTRHPSCASTLPPNREALASYLFSDYFEVTGEAVVPAVTVNDVLSQLGLDRIHWFKVDSQGTDKRLFLSIPDSVRARVLAVDVEPGLMDAYKGEDFFVDVHSTLIKSGFWISRCKVKGSVRLSRDSMASYLKGPFGDHAETAARTIRETPGWVEARYLRSPSTIMENGGDDGDFGVLWCFAMADDQPGFALDVAAVYEKTFGRDKKYDMMVNGAIERIRELGLYETAWGMLLTRLKAKLPYSQRQWLKQKLRR